MEFLFEKLDSVREFGDNPDIPEIIETGLADKIELREYQVEALQNFILYFEKEAKNRQIHTLFHMATGSGKTVVMAALILYLYTKGYRNFVFFVNQTNILEKTKDNFINNLSSKYLFSEKIKYLGNNVNIKITDNFSGNSFDNDIHIVFTTTQKLHLDLFTAKENAITYKDFEDNKVVFISDESHHINSMTKKETKDEVDNRKSWEYSVMNALSSNKDSVMLEFTATADLKDKNVLVKYQDKIVYDYPLIKFRKSGYTKDFKNFGTDSTLWARALIATVVSEYRKFLFADLKLNIKPVIMFKSNRISESEEFYNQFYGKIEKLESYELATLYSYNNEILNAALDYFKAKDDTFELLEHSIKDSFTKEKAIIINTSSDDTVEKQLLVNSLEDENNNIRAVFAVDKLNEGWDVLNLFDIVRLYDTRQGANSKTTISEAQLIGRGARYCPFKADETQEKYKRKYDNDLGHTNRVLETMYFHSKNDSKYISELRQALIETGLEDKDPIVLEYKLKEEFKESEFYKKALVFTNKRILKTRENINEVEGKVRNKKHRFTTNLYTSTISSLIIDDENKNDKKINVKSIKFKDIPRNILLGASQRFEEFKFNLLKEKYPNIRSIDEFLTADNYLGNNELEISYLYDIKAKDLYEGLVTAFNSIASHIISIKPEYEGSKEFSAYKLSSVLKDKKIYLSTIDKNGGKGDSQNNCNNPNYKLNLSHEDWYVFNDNFGTSEEKLFVKYFKINIEPKLKEKNLEFYLVRNERISDLAIYSFNFGERFEPDFLLFVRKKGIDNNFNSQVYIEPKGKHLLAEDEWKEDFLQEIENEYKIGNLVVDDFKILGMPSFNEENKMNEFCKAVNKFIDNI